MTTFTENIYISKIDDKLYLNGEVSNLIYDLTSTGTIEFFANFNEEANILSPDLYSSNTVIVDSSNNVFGYISNSFSIPTGTEKIYWNLSYTYNTQNNLIVGEINLNNFSYVEIPLIWDKTNKKTIEKLETSFDVTNLDPNVEDPHFYATVVIYDANTSLIETNANSVFESSLFDNFRAKFPYSDTHIEKRIYSTTTNDSIVDNIDICVKDFLQTYYSSYTVKENNLLYLKGIHGTNEVKISIYTSALNCEIGNTANILFSNTFNCSTTVNENLSFSESNNFTLLNGIKLEDETYSVGRRFLISLYDVNYSLYPNNYFCEITSQNNTVNTIETFINGELNIILALNEKLVLDFKIFDECGNYFQNTVNATFDYYDIEFDYGNTYSEIDLPDNYIDLSEIKEVIVLNKNEYQSLTEIIEI